jgi:hypothetical protein
MKVAVMQPYIFPYLGYFQLIQAADIFVFADDLNYIKGGWINRNRILLGGKAYRLTFPCRGRSQNRRINELELNSESKEYQKLLPTLYQAYHKAPCFKAVFPLVEGLIASDTRNLAEFAIRSVGLICNYLGIDTPLLRTSERFAHTKGQEKSDRLIQICRELHGEQYINPIGGTALYDKAYFKTHGVGLHFLEPRFEPYAQFKQEFVPGLSMLDVIMFNSVDDTHLLLNQYELI